MGVQPIPKYIYVAFNSDTNRAIDCGDQVAAFTSKEALRGQFGSSANVKPIKFIREDTDAGSRKVSDARGQGQGSPV